MPQSEPMTGNRSWSPSLAQMCASIAASLWVAFAAGNCLAQDQAGGKPPIASLVRLSPDPILSPTKNGFENAGAFNPAAVKVGSKTVLLYRAQDKQGVSSVGYAESKDGLHFQTRLEPLLKAETEYEKGGGMEDPRLVEIAGEYYLTYTSYNGKDAQLCLAKSKDLENWQRLGPIMPAYQGTWNKGWTKSGAILPQRVNGRYWMYYMGDASYKTTDKGTDQTGVASSTDLIHWQDESGEPVMPRRKGRFDSRVVEPGPPPIMTERGILLIYNGADDHLVYRTAWALFDKNDPAKLIARADKPLFEPEKEWEKVGQVPNVCFVEGAVCEGDRLRLYYGGADRCTGVAETRLLK